MLAADEIGQGNFREHPFTTVLKHEDELAKSVPSVVTQVDMLAAADAQTYHGETFYSTHYDDIHTPPRAPAPTVPYDGLANGSVGQDNEDPATQQRKPLVNTHISDHLNYNAFAVARPSITTKTEYVGMSCFESQAPSHQSRSPVASHIMGLSLDSKRANRTHNNICVKLPLIIDAIGDSEIPSSPVSVRTHTEVFEREMLQEVCSLAAKVRLLDHQLTAARRYADTYELHIERLCIGQPGRRRTCPQRTRDTLLQTALNLEIKLFASNRRASKLETELSALRPQSDPLDGLEHSAACATEDTQEARFIPEACLNQPCTSVACNSHGADEAFTCEGGPQERLLPAEDVSPSDTQSRQLKLEEVLESLEAANAELSQLRSTVASLQQEVANRNAEPHASPAVEDIKGDVDMQEARRPEEHVVLTDIKEVQEHQTKLETCQHGCLRSAWELENSQPNNLEAPQKLTDVENIMPTTERPVNECAGSGAFKYGTESTSPVMDFLRSVIAERDLRIEELESEVRSSKEENAQLAAAVRSADDLAATEITRLRDNLARKDDLIHRLEQDIAESNEHVTELQARLSELSIIKQENANLGTQSSRLQVELEQISERLRRAEQAVSDISQEKSNVEEMLHSEKQAYSMLEDDAEGLRDCINDFKAVCERLKDERSQLKLHLADMLMKYKSMQREAQKWNSMEARWRTEREVLLAQLNGKDAQISHLETQAAELHMQTNSSRANELDIHRIEVLATENAGLNKSVEEMKRENAALHHDLQRERRHREVEVGELQTSLTNLRTRFEQTKTRVHELVTKEQVLRGPLTTTVLGGHGVQKTQLDLIVAHNAMLSTALRAVSFLDNEYLAESNFAAAMQTLGMLERQLERLTLVHNVIDSAYERDSEQLTDDDSDEYLDAESSS
ncbi:hypothetical protein HDU85_004996 [Gaertneriomyces sp. JEL0708]|nr:hypothetical protein HDU85_004996 [Gaertneriomyces sp. JEL0708]